MSNAHKALAVRLRDVDQLMDAHAAIAGPNRGRKYEVVGINRAAILMLSAHFEGYLEDVMAEAISALDKSLQPKALIQGFHNPWPHRIDHLFSFLGMDEPSRRISWQKASNKAVRDNLRVLVGKRNQIAHGTTDVTVYKADVRRLRGYVEGFSKRFDQAVRQQVHRLTGAYPWP